MKGSKNIRWQDYGACSTRRAFGTTLTAFLFAIVLAPPSLGPGHSPDRGRWVLNERDH
jgi:hypothetical protein